MTKIANKSILFIYSIRSENFETKIVTWVLKQASEKPSRKLAKMARYLLGSALSKTQENCSNIIHLIFTTCAEDETIIMFMFQKTAYNLQVNKQIL